MKPTIDLTNLFSAFWESTQGDTMFPVLGSKDDLSETTLESLSTDQYNPELSLTLESYSQTLDQTIQEVDLLLTSALESGEISRVTMESYRSMLPSVTNKQYPTVSFTQIPTEQNLDVALEEFKIGKALLIAASGALLGGILFALIRLFRGDKLAEKIELSEKLSDRLQQANKTVNRDLKQISKTKDMAESDKDTLSLLMDDQRWHMALPKKPPTPPEGISFMESVNIGGSLYTTMYQWSATVNNQYTSFTARVAELRKLIETMYDVRGSAIEDHIKAANSVVAGKHDPFYSDMEKVNKELQHFTAKHHKQMMLFLGDAIYNTGGHLEYMVSNPSMFKAAANIAPKAYLKLDENLLRLEKEARSLTELQDIARNRKHKASSKRNDNSLEVEITGIGVNVKLEKAINDAKNAIIEEVKGWTNYRRSMSTMMVYYNRSMTIYEDALSQRLKLATELMNKKPSK